MGKVIDCKRISNEVRKTIEKACREGARKYGVVPCLAIITAGDDPASKIYVRNKVKACEEVGIISNVIPMVASSTTEEIVSKVSELANNPNIHGIIVQLPLPDHINTEKVLNTIPPEKDVDGLTSTNAAKLYSGDYDVIPCTPKGILEILQSQGIEIEGKHCVIIGRSNIVGKPMASLMLAENATVTVCHSHTKNLAEITRTADILIVAVGKANFITADMIKEGGVVIDVGINRNVDGKLVGDVDFDSVSEKASYITPVPGGVGVMTVTELLVNTYLLYICLMENKKQ